MEIPKISKRVTSDEVEIEGRTFKLKSFDPLLGNYILMKLFTFTLPFGISDMLKSKMGGGTEAQADNIAVDAPMMPKAEFLELQRDILSHVEEVLHGGLAPVVRPNGTYGISDFTMKIALQLLIAVIAFNFNDFFGDLPSVEGFTAG